MVAVIIVVLMLSLLMPNDYVSSVSYLVPGCCPLRVEFSLIYGRFFRISKRSSSLIICNCGFSKLDMPNEINMHRVNFCYC